MWSTTIAAQNRIHQSPSVILLGTRAPYCNCKLLQQLEIVVTSSNHHSADHASRMEWTNLVEGLRERERDGSAEKEKETEIERKERKSSIVLPGMIWRRRRASCS